MLELTLALLSLGSAMAGPPPSTESLPAIVLRSEPLADSERLEPMHREQGQRFGIAFGTRLGTVDLAQPWIDYRGQTIPAGHYGLRYALQPRLKDHRGADADRDFALLVPEAAGKPDQPRTPDQWIEASRQVSGTHHPAVMSLRPWEESSPPPASPVARGEMLVVFRTMGDLVMGFVVRGHLEPPVAY